SGRSAATARKTRRRSWRVAPAAPSPAPGWRPAPSGSTGAGRSMSSTRPPADPTAPPAGPPATRTARTRRPAPAAATAGRGCRCSWVEPPADQLRHLLDTVAVALDRKRREQYARNQLRIDTVVPAPRLQVVL